MIKVLEHGIRKITCPNCKAKLQYEQEDIKKSFRDIETFPGKFEDEDYEYIQCPDCGVEIILTPIKK